MAELDVEALKRSVIRSGATAWIVADQDWDAIIAALKDRDRLRAAMTKALSIVHSILLAKSELERLDIAAGVYSLLGAALEGRDG